jgi:bacillithiol biosynthesis cysteine-adding enzyme BshC
MTNLFEDYLNDAPALRAFYAGRPEDVFRAPEAPPVWRKEVLGSLISTSTDATLPRGYENVIATGQQAGLFTGPLYTIYKAVTAILLAQQAQERTGAAFVPVFWLGADDHDFQEAAVAQFLTKDHQALRYEYRPEQNIDGFPMYRVPLEPSLHAFIDELSACVPASEHREAVQVFLHDTLSQSASVGEWCEQLLAGLFRGTPLLILPPHPPDVRQAAAGIIEQEIGEPLASTRLLNEAGRALDKLGYPPQIVKNDNECSFFLEMGHRRRKVLFERDHFILPQEDVAYSREEMRAMLHAAPEHFSPNVALRCIVQQALLPVSAYVAGPGEIAYWAQLKPLFAHFGQPMPVVYPRARAVITTTKLKKLMDKYGFTLGDLAQPTEVLVERALRRSAHHPALAAVAQRRGELEAAALRLIEDLTVKAARHPDLVEMAKGLNEHLRDGLDRLERRILRSDQAQTETVRRQIVRLSTALMPDRKPQERIYSVFSFLFEQGWELIPRLMNSLDVQASDTQEIEL